MAQAISGIIAGLVILAGLLFYLLANYSVVERDFWCEGLTGTQSEGDWGRLRIEDFRLWVHLWSDDDAYGYAATHRLGNKFAVLKNHLGGFLSTYTDEQNDFVFDESRWSLRLQNQQYVMQCKPV